MGAGPAPDAVVRQRAGNRHSYRGVRYLRIEGAFYCGIGCLSLLYGFYRALGRPGMSVVLTVVSLGTRVALAYLLSSLPGVGSRASGGRCPSAGPWPTPWALCITGSAKPPAVPRKPGLRYTNRPVKIPSIDMCKKLDNTFYSFSPHAIWVYFSGNNKGWGQQEEMDELESL